MNNRLDYIVVSEEAKPIMEKCREDFIAIDDALRLLSLETKDPAILRTLALARTHLETACMYSIKSLALLGEKK